MTPTFADQWDALHVVRRELSVVDAVELHFVGSHVAVSGNDSPWWVGSIRLIADEGINLKHLGVGLHLNKRSPEVTPKHNGRQRRVSTTGTGKTQHSFTTTSQGDFTETSTHLRCQLNTAAFLRNLSRRRN